MIKGIKIKSLLFIVFIVVLTCLLCLDRINILIDDSFISLRCVNNTLNGHGSVFNPGEKIEVISNQTWVWVLSGISYLLNIRDLYLLFYMAKSVGLIFFIISTIILFRLLKSLTGNETFAFFTSLIYGLNPYIASYAMSGMENLFIYFLLITHIYFTYFFFKNYKLSKLILSSVFLGLLSISRPEGFIYIIIYYGSLILIILFRKQHIKIKQILPSFVVTIFIFFIFELWRFLFYGDIMPNSFYAKVFMNFRILLGNIKAATTFTVYGIGLFIPFFICSENFSYKKLDECNKDLLLIIALYIMIQFCVIMCTGSDWMPGLRFGLILVPIIILLLSITTFNTINTYKRKKLFYSILSLVIVANIFYGRIKLNSYTELNGYNSKNEKILVNCYFEDISYKLKDVAPKGASVLVDDLGLVSFLNPDLYFKDVYGLTDKHIAKEIKGEHLIRSEPDYFINKDFDFILFKGVFTNYSIDEQGKDSLNNGISLKPSMDIVTHKDFRKKYEPIYINEWGILFKKRNIDK